MEKQQRASITNEPVETIEVVETKNWFSYVDLTERGCKDLTDFLNAWLQVQEV